MKKVTIITPPEYESPILEAIGRANIIQFKPVTGPEFEALMRPSTKQVDWRTLYNNVHSKYLELKELEELQVEASRPQISELEQFTLTPEAEINTLLNNLNKLLTEFKDKKEEKYTVGNKLVEELQSILRKETREYARAYRALEALEPDELKKSFAVGIVKDEAIPQMEEYLKRYEDVFCKNVPIYEGESFLFVFGSEESREWVEALFLVFDIKDIFDVLDSRDILLVLDPKKRQAAISNYKEKLSKLEGKGDQDTSENKTKNIDQAYMIKIDKLKSEYEKKIKDSEKEYTKTLEALKKEQHGLVGKVAFYDSLLRNYQDKRAPVLRGKVISILQGYTPESKIDALRSVISEVEKQYGKQFFFEISEQDQDDVDVPTQPMYFNPSSLQPLWTLTSLRGWPSANEINPGYITILVFCLQFGLMYGDVGQGLLFVIIGLVVSSKFKTGMASKVGTLLAPMGLAAMIFGFLYDSIFLKEHLISEFLHNSHIELPFQYPVMPNPVLETTTLLKVVFLIAAIELVFGLILGAINQYKSGHKWGVIGEHGLGMILFIVGFYLTVMHFISIGMQFLPALNYWGFYLVIIGLALSFLEPIIAGVAHGHFTIDLLGEGVAGLLMTFVEGLANMFSFLRIAAFALAHASLAIAAHAMEPIMGIGGLLIMNVIALSFEFVSSTVQSLRLLYYEFMGKFYSGQGKRFTPFKR